MRLLKICGNYDFMGAVVAPAQPGDLGFYRRRKGLVEADHPSDKTGDQLFASKTQKGRHHAMGEAARLAF